MSETTTTNKAQEVFSVTDANFKSEVLETDQPTLVDFWAPWCAPCRAVGPTIEELAGRYRGAVRVAKLNVDENPQTPRAYGILSIPTVLIFKDSEVVDTLVGVQPRHRYEQVLDKVAGT